ncbi:hypothetical protein [Providencia burhodogranariea]|uniref:Uncharacterized protein n=1 Tax=Providencia burhodogranariea DSM 19968 TaxID=1141662 RepID=K8WTV7_9GAMM|nr:hypothetical protein [Providencia burhodogranariea]EKT59640.1 hypothetical protein OOA_13232 [Providencia burhodogranariea DSM 19968]
MSMMKINFSDKAIACIYNLMGRNISSKTAGNLIAKIKNINQINFEGDKNNESYKISESIFKALKRKADISKKSKFPVNINPLLSNGVSSLFTIKTNTLFLDRMKLSNEINNSLKNHDIKQGGLNENSCLKKIYPDDLEPSVIVSDNLELSELDWDIFSFAVTYPEKIESIPSILENKSKRNKPV